MSINKYTPIHRVLTTYPQLIHRLVKRDSRYVSLINPVSTCTLGHCTTIESIAFTVGDDMETLLTYLKGEMEREDIQFQYRFMLILYNKAARKNLSKPKEAAKWYPVLRSTGMLKEREVPKLIADKTTLNPKEAIARIEFKDVEVLTQKVTEGNSSGTTPIVVSTPEAPDPSI